MNMMDSNRGKSEVLDRGKKKKLNQFLDPLEWQPTKSLVLLEPLPSDICKSLCLDHISIPLAPLFTLLHFKTETKV